ncbi:MAG: class I SAM-dependent methyltransferase [Chloroflexota bacterium]
MKELSLAEYRKEFGRTHGAFNIDAALFFFAYGSLLADAGVRASVLEIGVHHGLSAIAVAALRGPGGRVIAVDTFGRDDRNIGRSGQMTGDEKTFRANIARYHPDVELQVIAGDSQALTPKDLPNDLSFSHIDGGHSAEETQHDLELASAASLPGALIAVDDHFNPSFPGVAEGSVRFLMERPGTVVPLAIGFNKVMYQRAPARGEINREFRKRFSYVPVTQAVYGGHEVLVLGSGFALHVDLDRSTGERLERLRDLELRVELESAVPSVSAAPGQPVEVPVTVRNRGKVPLSWGDSPFGLSYHVLRRGGAMERYENARNWFIPTLEPGDERLMPVSVIAPERAGDYVIEFDVVWEGHCWLRDRGSEPARVPLEVE